MASRDEAMRRLADLMRDSSVCGRDLYKILRDKLDEIRDAVAALPVEVASRVQDDLKHVRRYGPDVTSDKKPKSRIPWEQIFKYGPHLLYLTAIAIAHLLGRWWATHVH